MEKLFIIDASGYLYRSYFAIGNMTNAKGESTNALFGFIRSIQKLIKDFSPDYLIAVFDGPNNKQSRESLFSDYKAHRKETPQDLIAQISKAEKVCELLGIPTLCLPGIEADDTMGTVALFAKEKKAKAYLCTSDKDLCQLVDEDIFVLNTHKENLLLDAAGVKRLFHVEPCQIVDYLAIVGDASDNVPGLSGFGPKTAAALLEKFGSLEALLANPEKVPGKAKQQTLLQEKEKVLLSKQLVTIHKTAPIPKEPSFFKRKPIKTEQLIQFYNEMQFRTLLKELPDTHTPLPVLESYTLINDLPSFEQLMKRLSLQKEICFDTETTSIHPMEAEIVGIGFCVEQGAAFYIPFNGNLTKEFLISSLKPLFENPEIGFYGHHVKYDLHILENLGIKVAKISFDTMIASYLLNSHIRQHNLDALSFEVFGKKKIPIEDLIGKGIKAKTMDSVAIEKVATYCCEDVDYTFRLKETLEKELKARQLDSLFYSLEIPLIPLLQKMERDGIYLDLLSLNQSKEACLLEINSIEKEIRHLAGDDQTLNLNSPKQLSQKLIQLNIPLKKTKTGYSTSADTLEELDSAHPIIKKILEYRGLEKLRSTYFEALPKEICSKTGRIHCTFNQSVAATGRLSCQNPNLQNIPVRTDSGRKIREAFKPERPGWVFLGADYSQIELRLLAHFSKDPTLLKAFSLGEDIHSHTASIIFNTPLAQVTKEMRYQAKAVNFGVIYGQQSFGLARELGISEKEARHFINHYFERYDKVKHYLEKVKNQARQTGKSTTLTGRERMIPEISSTNAFLRQAAERLAVNTPLQGSSADLIKKAMLQINQALKKRALRGFLILQIHDELIFEIPEEEVHEWSTLVKKEMEEVYPLKVPLIVDVSIGKNWKEC